jgi:hypothetical protein
MVTIGEQLEYRRSIKRHILMRLHTTLFDSVADLRIRNTRMVNSIKTHECRIDSSFETNLSPTLLQALSMSLMLGYIQALRSKLAPFNG